jgi:hypothetical protein
MSDITTAFDAPWIEPVDGFGDVAFARADCDYWGTWAAQVKQDRVAKDLDRLKRVPILDPMQRLAAESKIENQRVFLGEVIDRQHEADGLKKIILDSIVRGGRDLKEAEAIRQRIGIGRQMQLATIICSEPMPTIEQYRDAVRVMCRSRGMPDDQVAKLQDHDLIRLAAEAPPPPPPKDDTQNPTPAAGDTQQSPIDTPPSTGS